MKTMTAMLYNGIAKRIWKTFDRIDAMPVKTLDDLCRKEKAIYEARKKFDSMPEKVREAVLGIRKSDLV